MDYELLRRLPKEEKPGPGRRRHRARGIREDSLPPHEQTRNKNPHLYLTKKQLDAAAARTIFLMEFQRKKRANDLLKKIDPDRVGSILTGA